MSYFDTHQPERINWSCSLNLSRYFNKNIIRGLFKPKSEYVAIWCNHTLTTEKTKSLIEVKFIELTNPTYYKKDVEYQSFLIIKIPLNYMHKVPFGSIWINGESTQRFILNTYSTTIYSDRSNFSIKSLAATTFQNGSHSFNLSEYVHHNDVNNFQWDKNQLLHIAQNNKIFVIHPLQFFMTHYGYSNELKRILSIYNWETIEHKLHLNTTIKADYEQPVILPRNLSHKDAVFLYHLKYDPYTRKTVQEMNAHMLLSKGSTKSYKIPCWHQQEIHLSFYGIDFGNTILCTQITGISQPQGNAIHLILAPKNQGKNKEDISSNANHNVRFRTVKQEREDNLDNLDIALNPVNNLVTVHVMEQLQLIGQMREIHKIQDTYSHQHNSLVKFIPYEEADNFSIGDKEGSLGNTGIINCFYDIIEEPNTIKSRLETVWDHATQLRSELNAQVSWYTPKCGFNESQDFRLISLTEVCKQLDRDYPTSALIVRVDLHNRTFFTISFPEKTKGSGLSSIIYEPKHISKFLDPTLVENNYPTLITILINVISLGAIDSDYIDSHNGKMSTFIHRTGENNNWVMNGLKKLL